MNKLWEMQVGKNGRAQTESSQSKGPEAPLKPSVAGAAEQVELAKVVWRDGQGLVTQPK